MLSNNEKKLLFIQTLGKLESIDHDTRMKILQYHTECYPIMESESGLIKGGIGLAIMGITCLAGGPIAAAIGLAVGGTLTGLGAYEAYKGYYGERENMENIADAVSSFAGSEVVSQSAKTTANIFQETKGTLVDKMNAIGELFESPETLNETHYEQRYSSVYGFDSDLDITDPDVAEEHIANYFYLMIGMDSTGKKVVDQARFNNAMKGFNSYWEKNKSFHITDSGEAEERQKYLKKYIAGLYSEYTPKIKEKIELARSVSGAKKSEPLSKRGMTEDGQVYDKKLYYSSMGFKEDGTITNMPLFMKFFKKETGLDEDYNPINDKGKVTHAKIYGTDKVMQYVTPATFLMLPDDVKKQVDIGRQRMENGEVQTTALRKQQLGGFDRLQYGLDNLKKNASTLAGGATATAGGVVDRVKNGASDLAGNVSDKAGYAKDYLADKAGAAGRYVKNGVSNALNAGQQKMYSLLGKAEDFVKSDTEEMPGRASEEGIDLISLYNSLEGKDKDMLMMGYLKKSDGKSYRLCDDDIYMLQSYIRDASRHKQTENQKERRKKLIERGQIKRNDMTPEEIEYANKYFKTGENYVSQQRTR